MLPTALALADLPDPDTLADALRKLADDRYHNDGLTLEFINTGPMSEPLKLALHHAITQAIWTSASRQLELHPGAHHRPADLDPRLGPQHVPQLFWAEDYHREIADLLDVEDPTDSHGRRFCSLLLTRMLSPMDWDAAARYLDLPDPFTNDAYNLTFAKLRSTDQFIELANRVKQIANQHAKNGLIDYKHPRQPPRPGRHRHHQLTSARANLRDGLAARTPDAAATGETLDRGGCLSAGPVSDLAIGALPSGHS
ncbi:MAG: hypothetical protein ACLP01_24970 [Solirubrobacteraceae bacterium]